MSLTEQAVDLASRGQAAGLIERLRALILLILSGGGDGARAGRRAGVAFLVRVASAALLYLTQVVLARWMGGFEYGIYVSVWTWVLVLGGISNLGLSTLMIRLVPEHLVRGEMEQLRGLLLFGRLVPVAAATCVAGIGFAILSVAGTSLSGHFALPAMIALLCIPMITLSDVQDGIGRGQGWMSVALLPPYVLRPLLVLLAMLAAHALGWPMTAVTAVGAAVAGSWVAAIIQSLLLSRRLRRLVSSGGRVRPKGLWLGTSLPLLAITFSEILLQNTDVLIISRYLSPAEVGMYFAAAKTMSLVMFVHYAVGSAMAGQFSALNAQGDREGLRQAVHRSVNWTFWPSLAVAVGLLVLGQPLLWLFGPQFVEGYPVMLVLVAGFLGRAAMGPSDLLLNMLGQQRTTAIAALSVAAVNIVLNLVLVPRLGLIGGASATALSLICGALLNMLIAQRKLGLRIGIWSNVGPAPR